MTTAYFCSSAHARAAVLWRSPCRPTRSRCRRPPRRAAPGSTAPVDGQDPADDGEVGAEITVTGQRERGSVPGDIQAEQVLRPADIRAYGAGSLTDLLTELAPQLGSGRGAGGGQPVVLLNGRRISGFREISSYPPEAIERVDILPPEAAQQLGYRADQRVINFVLRRRFNAVTAEVEGGGATAGDRYTADIDAALLRIMRDKRLNLAVELDARTPIYEDDRDVLPHPAQPPLCDPRQHHAGQRPDADRSGLERARRIDGDRRRRAGGHRRRARRWVVPGRREPERRRRIPDAEFGATQRQGDGQLRAAGVRQHRCVDHRRARSRSRRHRTWAWPPPA